MGIQIRIAGKKTTTTSKNTKTEHEAENVRKLEKKVQI